MPYGLIYVREMSQAAEAPPDGTVQAHKRPQAAGGPPDGSISVRKYLEHVRIGEFEGACKG